MILALPRSPIEFIDATLFMGMHSQDDAIRIWCKNFMIERFEKGVCMSLEEVGKCDDVVWQMPRGVQDAYYPFMDVLHSTMRISRVPYSRNDLRLAVREDMNLCDAQVLNQSGNLYRAPQQIDLQPELNFPGQLEQLYQASLVLRVQCPLDILAETI